jgi:hypothetical protein
MLTQPEKYVASGALISADGLYRYSLWREWRGTHAGEPLGKPRSVLFVMFNPSTAQDDNPTIRRCVGFCKSWKYKRLCVVNIFAYRTTQPSDLFAFQAKGGDAVGRDNARIIAEEGRDAELIVCAWGANAAGLRLHTDTVRGWLHGKKHYALGFTKGGEPRHPLYAPLNLPLVPMPD